MKVLYSVGIFAILWFVVACRKNITIPPPIATPVIINNNSLAIVSPTSTLEPSVLETATAIASITPSATPTATATPIPSERILIAQQAMFNGDYAEAVTQYAHVLPDMTHDEQVIETRLQLGMAQLALGETDAASHIFERLIQDFPKQAEPHFLLAQMASGNCADAIPHYEAYLGLEPEMESYRGGWIAACYARLGDIVAAVTQYERALEADAHFLVLYQNRLALARLYGQQDRYVDAEKLYGVIRDAARTPYTRGTMGYYAAEARIAMGDQAGGFAEYQRLIHEYPTLEASYNALVALVVAKEPVDDFQRGLVDYHAKVYAPCVEAFTRYVEEDSADFNPDAHRYLAYCYEGLANIGAALAQLDAYTAQTNSLNGLVEKADMLRRQGRWPEAIAIYQRIADPPPAQTTNGTKQPPPPLLTDRETARPHALWWLARLHDWRGEGLQAEGRYRQLSAEHPAYEHSAHALFRAGFLVNEAGDKRKAHAYWKDAALNYPNTQHGRASMTWLMPHVPNDEELREAGDELRPLAVYYSQRIQHLLQHKPPFERVEQFDFELDQQEADDYLRDYLDLDEDMDVATLSDALRTDPHIVRGTKLWRLRQWKAAKQEFEGVRLENSDDILASYQLALFFRDIGLYRSSIVAATSILNQTGDTVFEAPKFIAGLTYPAYYRDLVLPLAEQYDYDPLLQFALLRQESLYESFATSTAVAQGLAQVIPDTGTYIAQLLKWPNFKNADLYKPYVGVAFGAFYLNEQLARFDEHAHVALAAYNGGPGNAATWYETAGGDIDRYVETVTFRETRAYIERIYVGQSIYRYLYGVE